MLLRGQKSRQAFLFRFVGLRNAVPVWVPGGWTCKLRSQSRCGMSASLFFTFPLNSAQLRVLVRPLISSGMEVSIPDRCKYDTGGSGRIILTCINSASRGIEKKQTAYPPLVCARSTAGHRIDGRIPTWMSALGHPARIVFVRRSTSAWVQDEKRLRGGSSGDSS
jgi:hypothetical protein